eukprot:1296181-Prymnesium_polylepis.1
MPADSAPPPGRRGAPSQDKPAHTHYIPPRSVCDLGISPGETQTRGAACMCKLAEEMDARVGASSPRAPGIPS